LSDLAQDDSDINANHGIYRRFRKGIMRDHSDILIDAGAQATPPVSRDQAVLDSIDFEDGLKTQRVFRPPHYVMPYVLAEIARLKGAGAGTRELQAA